MYVFSTYIHMYSHMWMLHLIKNVNVLNSVIRCPKPQNIFTEVEVPSHEILMAEQKFLFHQDQGCQMVYFQTKNPPIWVNFGGP
jgi:hypothetical protein